MRISLPTVTGLCLMLAGVAVQAADGMFEPRVIVNDSVVTNYEVEQRAMFLATVSATGDLQAQALKDLVDERLKLAAAKSLKIELTPKQINEGLAEFAGRAKLSVDEFTKILGDAGIAPETFRDFVRAGLIWRELVRQKFVPITFVSEGEIDRAASVTKVRGDVRVLLSELILPAPKGQEQDALAQAQELASSIRTVDDFSAAAQQYSAAPSAQQGGKIDWIDLGNLPPPIRELVLPLQPGQVTPPITLPNAYGLFQLRGLQDTGRPATVAVKVDYLQLLLPDTPDGLAQVARIRAGADRCEDVYALVKGATENQITRQSEAAGAVPRDIAIDLAKLNAGESSAGLRREGNLVFLMLCARDVVPVLAKDQEPPTRDQIRTQILNERLGLAADGYLRQLRAAAVIREP